MHGSSNRPFPPYCDMHIVSMKKSSADYWSYKCKLAVNWEKGAGFSQTNRLLERSLSFHCSIKTFWGKKLNKMKNELISYGFCQGIVCSLYASVKIKHFLTICWSDLIKFTQVHPKFTQNDSSSFTHPNFYLWNTNEADCLICKNKPHWFLHSV